MPDRTINFGESETEATYQIQDTDAVDGGGNFVVAKDTNANTVLLEYDPATDTWEYAGDVDMNGGNVSAVGTLTADSVNTDDLTIDTLPYLNSVAEFDTDGETADISLPSPIASLDGKKTIVEAYFDPGSNRTDWILRLNGDGDTTGNYRFEDNSGATSSDENQIPIATADDTFMFASTTIEISQVSDVSLTFETRVRQARGTSVAVSGEREVGEDLSSIQLIPDGAARNLYGRIYTRDLV